jgi:hypothetical protein
MDIASLLECQSGSRGSSGVRPPPTLASSWRGYEAIVVSLCPPSVQPSKSNGRSAQRQLPALPHRVADCLRSVHSGWVTLTHKIKGSTARRAASRRVVGIEHAILGGDQSEGVSSPTGASSLSTTA